MITVVVIGLYYVITKNMLGLVLYVFCALMLITKPQGNYHYTKFFTWGNRFREVNQVFQHHTTSKWRIQNYFNFLVSSLCQTWSSGFNYCQRSPASCRFNPSDLTWLHLLATSLICTDPCTNGPIFPLFGYLRYNREGANLPFKG